MVKCNCSLFKIVNGFDKLRNPITEKVKMGSFWTDYIIPISFDEVQKMYGNNNKITYKTCTRHKGLAFNDEFEYEGKQYRIEKIQTYPNGISMLYLEGIK